ncbi:ABC transporter permease [Georgenia subflava]|uniref:ABC transporter permease n=1 Tax=Georgenia subflava TaxID=1622177 RepID=A0A6N7ELB8_9MICO|nr:ABC transporter permease [Georgenia subflava]MPV38929.1 ABC transporter permease [Georgenia subflava]
MSTFTASVLDPARSAAGDAVHGSRSSRRGPDRAVRPIPFTRLASVELRKQLDTRAGVWLLAVIALITAGIIALVLFTGAPADLTWNNLTGMTSMAQVLLLPLIGILAATSEWSQRTALTTLALEPRRTRVNAAKLVSAWLLGLVLMAVTLLVAAVFNVVGQVWFDGDGSWTMQWELLAGMVLALLLLVTQGVAFGLALLSTPIAIVAYLALPTAWSVLTMLVSGLQDPAKWLDINTTMMPLMTGQMTGTAWAHLGTSVAVWILAPLVFGVWRTARRDVA